MIGYDDDTLSVLHHKMAILNSIWIPMLFEDNPPKQRTHVTLTYKIFLILTITNISTLVEFIACSPMKYFASEVLFQC